MSKADVERAVRDAFRSYPGADRIIPDLVINEDGSIKCDPDEWTKMILDILDPPMIVADVKVNGNRIDATLIEKVRYISLRFTVDAKSEGPLTMGEET
jgi:hypothetical protein